MKLNFKILLIVAIAGIGILSYGVLANDVELEIQKFEILVMPPMDGVPIEGTTEFTTMQCSCSNPNNPNEFGPGFCDVSYTVSPNGPDGLPGTADDIAGIPAPNSLGAMGNKLCTWEVSAAVYGDLLDYDQGCSANYWLKSSDPTSPDYSWPSEYQPDYLYSDIFNISLVKADSNDDKIQKMNDKIKQYKIKVNDLVNQKKITTQTATSLLWLLDGIPLPEYDGFMVSASEKLASFYKRIDLYVDRKLLLDIDKKYILEVIEDSQENPGHKLTLLDALSNSILSPPDDKLAKESVAALLNAAHTQVMYHYSVSDIMKMTIDAVNSNDEINTANNFMKHNLAGASPLCP